MRIFETLQELINYIPTCVICGKDMKLSIAGYVSAIAPSKPKWGGGTERIYLKMELKDGILHCKHKSFNVAIETATNHLIDGGELINRLMLNTINVKKCCPTCVFKSMCTYQEGNTKKTNCFPHLILRTEELNYTMRGGKRCMIMKHHNVTDKNEPHCYISINNISLQPVPLDFTKLTSLEQINKKVKTITVFS